MAATRGKTTDDIWIAFEDEFDEAPVGDEPAEVAFEPEAPDLDGVVEPVAWLPDADGVADAGTSWVKRAADAVVTQLVDATSEGEYGMFEMAPSDSGGCAYEDVTPSTTYMPGTVMRSESQTSNSPS